MHLVPSQPTGGARFLGLGRSLLLLRGSAVVWVFGSAFLPPGPGGAPRGRSFPLGRW